MPCEDRDTERAFGHGRREAEIGMVLTQAKEHLGSGAPRS